MKCPCCDGVGGDLDVITDDGQGVWYPCGLCDGTGKVRFREYAFYKYLEWREEHEAKKDESRASQRCDLGI